MIGTTELMAIGVIVFVLFGSAAIPKLARALGQAKAEFQKGIKSGDTDSDASDPTAK